MRTDKQISQIAQGPKHDAMFWPVHPSALAKPEEKQNCNIVAMFCCPAKRTYDLCTRIFSNPPSRIAVLRNPRRRKIEHKHTMTN
jgi:hypothetical protein